MTLPAIARNSDPETSHEAAERFTRSGTRQTHGEMVLAAVQAHPGSTAAELGDYTGLGHIATQRRLSDLANIGKVLADNPRPCTVKGTRMQTYTAVAQEPRQTRMEDVL